MLFGEVAPKLPGVFNKNATTSISLTGQGTAGQILTSNGTGLPPTFQNAPATSIPTGTMFNFKSTNTTTVTSVTSATPTIVTDLNVTITPTSASNQVLVRAVIQVGSTLTDNSFFYIARGSTPIGRGAASGSRTQVGGCYYTGASGFPMGTIVMEFLDTPATTSATTYNVYMWTSAGSSVTKVNASSDDTNSALYPRASSTISVFEIQA
jgi:hypothetical protein